MLSSNYHRGIGDEDSKDEDDKITIREALPFLDIFKGKIKWLTQFFSTSDVNILFRNLTKFISENATTFKFNKTSFGSSFGIIKEVGGKVDITINILKVKGQEKYCIQAIRNSGNIFAFTEIYNEIKAFFGGHVNAVYEA